MLKQIGHSRGRTLNTKHIQLEKDIPTDHWRPSLRSECPEDRPCPYVGCKYHLYLDVNPRNGSIKFNFPGIELEDMPETCVLDVADSNGIPLEEVGDYINMTKERIRQVGVSGLAKLKLTPLAEINWFADDHKEEEMKGKQITAKCTKCKNKFTYTYTTGKHRSHCPDCYKPHKSNYPIHRNDTTAPASTVTNIPTTPIVEVPCGMQPAPVLGNDYEKAEKSMNAIDKDFDESLTEVVQCIKCNKSFPRIKDSSILFCSPECADVRKAIERVIHSVNDPIELNKYRDKKKEETIPIIDDEQQKQLDAIKEMLAKARTMPYEYIMGIYKMVQKDLNYQEKE